MTQSTSTGVGGWRGVLACAITVTLTSLSGCSSSSTGSSGIPGCKNPPLEGPDSNACSACVEQQCGSEVSTWESACSSYLSCYAACDCSQSACLQACNSMRGTSCSNAESVISKCVFPSCAVCAASVSPLDGGAD